MKAIGRPELLKRHGHYEISLGPKSGEHMQSYAKRWPRSGSRPSPCRAEQLLPLQRAANAATGAGLWFEDSAFIIDPLEAVRALVAAALKCGATFQNSTVTGLVPRGDKIEVLNDAAPLIVDSARGLRRRALRTAARRLRLAGPIAGGARLSR